MMSVCVSAAVCVCVCLSVHVFVCVQWDMVIHRTNEE